MSVLDEKKLKKVIKEGGKRGVEIEGAADMVYHHLPLFLTTMCRVVYPFFVQKSMSQKVMLNY
jgi:hypothetical protein